MRYALRLIPVLLLVMTRGERAAASPTSSPELGVRVSGAAQRGPSAPWVGMNVWALAAAADVYTCGATSMPHQQALDATFEHLRGAGVSVVRFWAFQSYAMGPDGERKWDALDRVFAAAEAHGVWLIPVLSNNWRDCDYWPVSLYPNGGQRKDAGDWYRTGYRSPYDGYRSSYVAWIDEVVGRYGSRGRVLTWEVANEPQARSTSSSDRQAFEAFLGEAVARIRANDTSTPISLGSMGTGQPGFEGAHYGALLSRLADVATAHDYDLPDEALPRVGCSYNCLRADLVTAAQAGRPFYVGEAGIQGCDAYRSDRLIRKMEATFGAGAQGYVFWAYREDASSADCGFDIGPQSALMQRLRTWTASRDASTVALLAARTVAARTVATPTVASCAPVRASVPAVARLFGAARTPVSKSVPARCAPVVGAPTPRAAASRARR
ncbi:MAG: beta-galactosidase [Dehalococcoidia bacterium]